MLEDGLVESACIVPVDTPEDTPDNSLVGAPPPVGEVRQRVFDIMNYFLLRTVRHLYKYLCTHTCIFLSSKFNFMSIKEAC